MNTQVNREVVKIGLDFRPIPIDLGDGMVWNFTSDPSTEQWTILTSALRKFSVFQGRSDEDILGGGEFEEVISGLTAALAEMLVDTAQKDQWIDRSYGIGPQQRVSEYLMETWSGFPTQQPSSSGKELSQTGSD